jgi:DNA-3-methyladenine glycosylase II
MGTTEDLAGWLVASRPDDIPADDVGLRTALGRLEGMATPPTQPETVALALRWTPYRSYAAAHLWRLLGE